MDIESQMFQYGIGRHDRDAKVYLGSLPSTLAAVNNGATTNDTAIGCMVLIPAKLKVMVMIDKRGYLRLFIPPA